MSVPMPSAAPPFGRLLLTGAAGTLGRVLRPRLKPYCNVLRLSDLGDLGAAAPGEELVSAALQDKAAVRALLAGVDAVVHLGGISIEHAFEDVLPANITGMFHLYEAARLNGVRRIAFASSNHVVGFYRQNQVIDSHAAPRPDTYYGLSKAFGEDLAQFYWERHGIETVSMRIGSATPAPTDRRMLSTWLSFDDLERLVLAALTAPLVGHSVVYGVSANRVLWWDNDQAAHIGYRPQDSSEPFRAAIEAAQPPRAADDPTLLYHGGVFTTQGPFE